MTVIHTYGLTGPAKAEFLRLHRNSLIAAFGGTPNDSDLTDLLDELDAVADAPIPQAPLVVPPGGALHDRLTALEGQLAALGGTPPRKR